MEIKDYGELNALNKLLGMIKFQEDLDFYEFRELAGSPFIAEIFKRVHEEFWNESVRRGYLETEQKAVFKFDGTIGKVLRKRIDELTENELNTLVKNNDLNSYLEILIAPMEVSQEEFLLLKQYAEGKVK